MINNIEGEFEYGKEGLEKDLENVNKTNKGIEQRLSELEDVKNNGPYFKEAVEEYKKATDHYKSEILSVKNKYALELDITELMQKTAEGTLEHLIHLFPEEEIKEHCPEVYEYYADRGGLEKGIELFDERKKPTDGNGTPRSLTKDEILDGLSKKTIKNILNILCLLTNPTDQLIICILPRNMFQEKKSAWKKE